jgi:TonB family protein
VKSPLSRLCFWSLIVVLYSVSLFGSTMFGTTTSMDPRAGWEERERQLWTIPARASQFNDVPHTGNTARCEDVQAPEALTTPNPLVVRISGHSRVKVSFIIGTDGHVHSPLILESAGPTRDQSVLNAVRIWRFRPATCNGVPTEIEGKIEFSSR